MSYQGISSLVRRLAVWADSSPRQSFVLYPLGLLAFETLRRRRLWVDWRAMPLLLAGYGLYRFGGSYRRAQQAGGPGFSSLPARLLTSGPYAYTRNPMYLGHLVFSLGLALALRSPMGLLLFIERVWRFHSRVLKDEQRLTKQFGYEYRAYLGRVKRWIPGIL